MYCVILLLSCSIKMSSYCFHLEKENIVQRWIFIDIIEVFLSYFFPKKVHVYVFQTCRICSEVKFQNSLLIGVLIVDKLT